MKTMCVLLKKLAAVSKQTSEQGAAKRPPAWADTHTHTLQSAEIEAAYELTGGCILGLNDQVSIGATEHVPLGSTRMYP